MTVVVLLTVTGGGFAATAVYRLLATALAKVDAKEVLKADDEGEEPAFELSVFTAAASGVTASAGKVGTIAGGLPATAASSYATTSLANDAADVPAAPSPFAALFTVVAAF